MDDDDVKALAATVADIFLINKLYAINCRIQACTMEIDLPRRRYPVGRAAVFIVNFSITIGQPVPKYDVMGLTWRSDLSFASFVLFSIRGW